jgi:hypothetical protein
LSIQPFDVFGTQVPPSVPVPLLLPEELLVLPLDDEPDEEPLVLPLDEPDDDPLEPLVLPLVLPLPLLPPDDELAAPFPEVPEVPHAPASRAAAAAAAAHETNTRCFLAISVLAGGTRL